MKKSIARKNGFEGMIREFENNIFKNNCDDFPVWCFFRYSREGKNKSDLLLDFICWLDGMLMELRPIKKLCWRIYPEIKYDESQWRIFTRFAVLRQTGKNVKKDIRYPLIPPRFGMLPMPNIGKNRKKKS